MTASNGKTAIVTGAAGGMGRAISARLAEDGFHVLMTDMNEAALAEAAAGISGSVEYFTANLGDADARAALIDRAGDLFALVNTAGIFNPAPIADLTGADFSRMYDINTIALFELSKLAMQRMAQSGGRIVNIASRAYLGSPNVAHYAASKGAVVSLTRCMALELAPDNILVNAIAPGVIETPILAGWSDEERAKLASYQPLGRIGQPKDVANVASMLASPRTDYITGQVIIVDGGRSVGGGNV